MKTWKIIRIYKLEAKDKAEALKQIHAEGAETKFFDAEFAVEDKPVGLWGQIWKQVLG
jgi:hypothetical protein